MSREAFEKWAKLNGYNTKWYITQYDDPRVECAYQAWQAAQAQAGEGDTAETYYALYDALIQCQAALFSVSSDNARRAVEKADIAREKFHNTAPPAQVNQQKFDESIARWRHDSEELEALHMNLDDAKAPRDEGGKCLSAWGRVVQYAQVNQQLLEALQAVLECGSTTDQWWIDKARAAIAAAQEGE
jgi:hypothetical protein